MPPAVEARSLNHWTAGEVYFPPFKEGQAGLWGGKKTPLCLLLDAPLSPEGARPPQHKTAESRLEGGALMSLPWPRIPGDPPVTALSP